MFGRWLADQHYLKHLYTRGSAESSGRREVPMDRDASVQMRNGGRGAIRVHGLARRGDVQDGGGLGPSTALRSGNVELPVLGCSPP
jgi:hypothetical protein